MDVTLVPGDKQVIHISLFLVTVSSSVLPLFTGHDSLCFSVSPISPPYNCSSWHLPVILNEPVYVFSQPWLWESRLAHGHLVPAWTKSHQADPWVSGAHPPELSGTRQACGHLQPTQTLRVQQFILFSSVHFYSVLTNSLIYLLFKFWI